MYDVSDPHRIWDLVGVVLLFDFGKKKIKYNNIMGNILQVNSRSFLVIKTSLCFLWAGNFSDPLCLST